MIISQCKSTSAFIAFSLEPSCHDMRWIRLTIRLRQNESEHHLRQTLRKPYETQEKCTFQMNYFQPNTKWVRGTLERCSIGAYAAHTFEGVPTQGQRPCKVMPQHTFFAYAVTLSASFGNLETQLLLTPPQSHQRFCSLTDMLCGILQPQSNQAPKRSRHLAATPCSGTSTHIQKRTRNIWLYTIEDSATLDHARGKSSDVFDGD